MNRIAISTLALAALACPASASVVISNKATKHMSCSGGICTPTAKNSVLNVGDLQTMLASGDVTVNTGTGAVSIAVSAPVTWASTSRLTLSAANVISIRAAVVVEGTGAMTLAPSGAGLSFYPGGSIAFWDNVSSLVISGHGYTLVSDIATLASDVQANPAGFYALAKDYDASGDSFGAAAVSTALTGTFEGLGHTISNFSINDQDEFQVGLFSEIDGTARDLTMSNGNITCGELGSGAQGVGLLVGENKGVVKGISVSGTINCHSGRDIGGVAGDNTAPGIISNATSAVNIPESHAHAAGGLVGVNTGTIQKSSASGDIVGDPGGGLVGTTSGTITDSRATGSVLNAAAYSGGLAGIANGTILRCSASGNVSAKTYTGGLVGFVSSSLTIDSSFATGAAASANAAGGLAGFAGGGLMLVNSYARGAATGTIRKVQGIGGLIGVSNSAHSVATSYSTGAPSGAKNTGGSVGAVVGSVAVTDVYWDLDTSGISDPSKGVGNSANYPGVTGLTTAQFQSGLPAGFDPAVWAQSPSINNGYPYLIANPPQ
jgi:hypothetical protein